MPGGVKHLVECHCILPQFKKSESIVFHKFTVYSKLTEKGDVIEKTVQCNNCNVIHKVSKLCNSRILAGRDEYSAGMSIEDLSVQLDSKISNSTPELVGSGCLSVRKRFQDLKTRLSLRECQINSTYIYVI